MPPPPERRVLGEPSSSEHNRLQVRLVPYTPPRLSSDSALSPPAGPDSLTTAGRGADRAPTCPDASPSSKPRPEPPSWSRPKFIGIRGGRAFFSPLPPSASTSSAADSFASPRHSSTVPSASCDLSFSSSVHIRPCSPLTSLPEALPASPAGAAARPDVEQSPRSSHSASTLSERSNYKTYAHRSPAAALDVDGLVPTSSRSTRGQSCSDRLADSQTGHGEANYLVHGRGSPTSSFQASPSSRLGSEYSRESLLVAPLKPARRGLAEQPGLSRSRRRDSVRTASLSSMSTIIFEEAARSLLAGVATIHHVPGGPRRIECPRAIHSRGALREPNHSTIRPIRDHDEHGDGLADLEQLHHRHSRARLYSSVSNTSIDRNLTSSASSHSSSSFTRSSIPAWARLYYGSGERRPLAVQPSSDSLFSQFSAGSQSSRFLSRSPSLGRFPAAIYSPRRRPRAPVPPERHGEPDLESDGETASDVVAPVARGLRQQNSSIWSPHLGHDRRAIGQSIWEAPSAVWSIDGPVFCRRNLQPVLFLVGFIFPPAWMVASFLPLPPRPQYGMIQTHHSTSHLHLRLEARYPLEKLADARRYSRARWWRSLNRAMSIVGMFVIGAVIALIVTGVQQRIYDEIDSTLDDLTI